MERIHAYIDESGAYGFDFSKEATPHLNLLRKVRTSHTTIVKVLR